MKKFNKKGFTIVELVIVIAVIAILAAVLIPTFNSVINKAKESSAMQKARNTLTIVTAERAESATGSEVYYFTVKETESSSKVFKFDTAKDKMESASSVPSTASSTMTHSTNSDIPSDVTVNY